MSESLTDEQLNKLAGDYSFVLGHSLVASGIDIKQRSDAHMIADLSKATEIPAVKPHIQKAIHGAPGQPGAYLDINEAGEYFKEEVKKAPDFVCRKFTEDAMRLHGDEIKRDLWNYFDEEHSVRPKPMDYTDPGLLWKLADMVTEVFGYDVDGVAGKSRLYDEALSWLDKKTESYLGLDVDGLEGDTRPLPTPKQDSCLIR